MHSTSCYGLVFGFICLSPLSVSAQSCPSGGGCVNPTVLEPANSKVAAVLALFDIDGDGLPDGSPDSDGDGLPDNWEVGGCEPLDAEGGRPDRAVSFSAPSPIGPGTPPTFVLARLTVKTSACSRDTDGDGLSDFVEVFGLKFIDDNGNGILDADEWMDTNNDGLPSIGEYPLAQHLPLPGDLSEFDFDGFVFTDPASADTDGDGTEDGEDFDPLINPQTFGVDLAEGVTFTRPGVSELDKDLDNDGLGNGSDFGNDTTSVIDYPTGVARLVKLFRPDRVAEGTIPESLIEDMVGVDWNGDGLYRITDIRDYATTVTEASLQTRLGLDRYRDLFEVDSGAKLFAEATAQAADAYGQRGMPLGMQELLMPTVRSLPLFPDVRVWTVLYAWRTPGFDIDGDGYVGPPENNFRDSDAHPYKTTGVQDLDGVIEVDLPAECGNIGAVFGFSICIGLGLTALVFRLRSGGLS